MTATTTAISKQNSSSNYNNNANHQPQQHKPPSARRVSGLNNLRPYRHTDAHDLVTVACQSCQFQLPLCFNLGSSFTFNSQAWVQLCCDVKYVASS